jgi:26S proteasome regulatory subunit N1
LIPGLQDASDATLETLKAIEHPISKTAQILVEICSFAGTGNVLKVQGLLHHCDEHIVTSKDKEEGASNQENKEEGKEEIPETPADDTFQVFAVLGVALVAMGEDIGAEMSLRQFNHLVSRSIFHLVISTKSNHRCTTVNPPSEKPFLLLSV